MRNGARSTAAQGFTLVELLAATALFVVLGAMLFQMVRGAGDIWSRGQQVRDAEEKAAAVLELLAEDLRHLWPGVPGGPEPAGRLLCSWRLLDGDGDGVAEQRSVVLRFTRLLHEARRQAWLRRAGEVPGAQGVASLASPQDPALLLPTGGLAESLYTTAVLPGESLPSLVRRVRTPIGGAGSLLDPELPSQADRLLQDGLRLADRVLLLEVLFWGPGVEDWEPAPGATGLAAARAWDSTRGLLALDEADFPWGRGPGSLAEGGDDVFPALVKVRLVLDVSEDEALGVARLAQDVEGASTTLVLTAARALGDEGQPTFLWLEGEWVAVEGRRGRELVVRRGCRGSVPVPHRAGAVLRAGLSFERVLAIPAAREALQP